MIRTGVSGLVEHHVALMRLGLDGQPVMQEVSCRMETGERYLSCYCYIPAMRESAEGIGRIGDLTSAALTQT